MCCCTLAGFATSTRIIEGSMSRGSQYHFYMENLSCKVVPSEGSYDVTATTQWTSGTQAAIAQVLAVDANRFITFVFVMNYIYALLLLLFSKKIKNISTKFCLLFRISVTI